MFDSERIFKAASAWADCSRASDLEPKVREAYVGGMTDIVGKAIELHGGRVSQVLVPLDLEAVDQLHPEGRVRRLRQTLIVEGQLNGGNATKMISSGFKGLVQMLAKGISDPNQLIKARRNQRMNDNIMTSGVSSSPISNGRTIPKRPPLR